ncbi:MAG: hypothetical protein ACHP7N_12115 [Caulobacterales bacterium]
MKVLPRGDVEWRGKTLPRAFGDLGLLMHQDASILYGRSENELVEGVVAFLTAEQKADLLSFLGEALDGRYTSAELKGMWNKTRPQVSLRDSKGVRRFLQAVRDRIAVEAAGRPR